MSTANLLTQIEVLKSRVEKMEVKDEELTRMADQCQELDRKLARENFLCHGLRVEVAKLNGRISELDRMEEALGKSKQDCSALKNNLEQEREVSRMLTVELDTLKHKVRELERVESQMEKTEMVVRQDLGKLRSLTVALVEERKNMAEKLKRAEETVNRRDGQRNDQGNLPAAPDKLKEEKQLALGYKADLEDKLRGILKEKFELQNRLRSEEERNRELEGKVSTMKKKIDVFDNNRKKERYVPLDMTHQWHVEDNKVKELTQELETLRKRVQDKDALKRELMRAEENFESLERKLQDEQRRTQNLSEELESTKRELSRFEQEEKMEVNQEHLLLCHLQKEQVKSRLLTRELDLLKEKLERLTGTEKSIGRVQMNQTRLQRKLTQQEAKNKKLAMEMEELKSELDEYRDVQSLQVNKEVQTEPLEGTLDVPSNPNHTMGTAGRNSQLNNPDDLDLGNNWMQPKRLSETSPREVMMFTHSPGQPLQIKVTPNHSRNTAMFEISSPSEETITSYTSTAVLASPGASSKQRISIIQTSRNPDVLPSRLDCGTPPAAPPCAFAPDNTNSPMKIVTVRTCSPEATAEANQDGFCVTPEQLSQMQSQQQSDGGDSSPTIIATEDRKIHIHLGSQYLMPLIGTTGSGPQAAGPYCLQHQQSTQVISNGCHVKSVGKITSSITISPALTPASHSSNITVKGLYSCD